MFFSPQSCLVVCCLRLMTPQGSHWFATFLILDFHHPYVVASINETVVNPRDQLFVNINSLSKKRFFWNMETKSKNSA